MATMVGTFACLTAKSNTNDTWIVLSHLNTTLGREKLVSRVNREQNIVENDGRTLPAKHRASKEKEGFFLLRRKICQEQNGEPEKAHIGGQETRKASVFC